MKQLYFLIIYSTILLVACQSNTPESQKTIVLPNGAGLEMIYVQPGTFKMGSTKQEIERHGDEGPIRDVTIGKGFYLGKYELTQAQWKAVMDDNPSVFRNFEDSDKHPVDNVSWDDAQKYIDKLNSLNVGRFRLPTEAEWEYACRAGTTTRYYWGIDSTDWKVHEYAWAFPRSEGRSHPVGTKKPNPWGFYDMSGNVWEWCLDWRTSAYDTTETKNPKGAISGKKKIYRGGSWFNKPATLRSANRNGHEPDTGGGTNSGFRVLMEL